LIARPVTLIGELAFWQTKEVKLPQVPLNTSTYVVAEVKFVPVILTLITCAIASALNLYQTSYVVVEVAPPQPPVGAALVALNRVPVVEEQVAAGVRVVAFVQASLVGAAANNFVLTSRKITTLPNIFRMGVGKMGTGIFIILGSFRVFGF
jgi:hypothetical protein